VYVHRKSLTHNPARKLPTRARKETSNLVLMLLSEFPRKSTLRKIATSARSMGVHILLPIQETVVSMRDTEWRRPNSMPPRKVERNPFLQSSFKARNWTSLRRQSSKRAPSPRKAIGLIVILTPNRE
jgi:hypothetical protein